MAKKNKKQTTEKVVEQNDNVTKVDLNKPVENLVEDNVVKVDLTKPPEQKETNEVKEFHNQVWDNKTVTKIPSDEIEIIEVTWDPFIVRDIESEFTGFIQSFNLNKYGQIFCKFIINQIRKEEKDSLWIMLGILFC